MAVAKLTKGDLKQGDVIKIADKDGNLFKQKVGSMQIEHTNIEIAKSGDEFGIKVDKPIKKNSDIIKV